MLLLAVLSFCATSCSDSDSNGGGVPEITGVRVPDPAKADSLFQKAGAGQVIAIMGKNLGGVMKVFINDQEVYFNPTMNTDHSVIVNIPTEEKGFKLTAFNSDLKDEIRVETNHGTAVYSFKITAPYPSITRFAAPYPRDPGNIITIYGFNFVDIEEIFFTDATMEEIEENKTDVVPGNHYAVTDYTLVVNDHALDPATQSYKTTSVMEFVMPSGVPEVAVFCIKTAAGVTYWEYTYRPGVPSISYISNDLPQIGETVYITGLNFVQVESITYGDVTVSAEDLTVAEDEMSLSFVFNQKPSVLTGTDLVLTTPGGEAKVSNFYDFSTVIVSFDRSEGEANNGWGPDALYVDGGTADGKYAHINVATEYQQWWGTMIYFRYDWGGNSFKFSDNIPESASADDVYFAMNVYDDNSSYNNGTFSGYLRFLLQGSAGDQQYDNFAWDNYNEGTFLFPDGPVLQDINGVNHKQMWYRHVVPMSKFPCFAGKTYKDIKSTGFEQFRIQSINQGTASGKIDVKFDNIRVVYIPKTVE